MNATKTVIATIEGPQGVAEVIELDEPGKATQYETRFQGKHETLQWIFPSMGEAYIEAKQRAGVTG
jgi:hypothetical protein